MERKRKYISATNLTHKGADHQKASSRNVKQIITPHDFDQLKRHYKFVLDEDNFNEEGDNKPSQESESDSKVKKMNTTWQERMVRQYHSHLYKTHVIADFSKYETPSSQIGLRWRTEAEVASGFGVDTCGNKYCPCYFMNPIGETMVKAIVEDVVKWSQQRTFVKLLSTYYHSSQDAIIKTSSKHGQSDGEIKTTNTQQAISHDFKNDERQLLDKIPYGIGLDDYQVHFAYMEDGIKKEELVKLKLCLRCAPILFRFRGGEIGAKNARQQCFKTEKD